MTAPTRHCRWAPYFFIGPFLIIFLTFVAYPMVHSLALSTQQTYGPRSSRFVGLSNFTYLASDPLFWKAMRNTVIFAAGSLFIQLPCSLALALLLNSPRIRGRTVFRLIFFSPSLIGLTFVGVIFSLIFEKRTGLLNLLLHRAIGFDLEFPWLEEFVMPALIIAAFWMYVGFNMVYFLAALQNVRQDLVEAAIVDGANAWQRFRHVTVPAIRPVAAFIILLSMVGSFQLFELPWLLLNLGGGPDNQGLTLVMYLYQIGFETGDLGYASTVGWVLALILGGLAAGQHYLARAGET